MPVDFYVSEPHFADHLTPIWEALPPSERGRFVTHPRLAANRVGIPVEYEPSGLGTTVVASYGDLRKARKHTDRIIYMEHGAGQSYDTSVETGSYLGAADRDGVIAILVPGPHAYTRAVAAYPEIPVFMVGCPKLDRLAAIPRPNRDAVAVSFHWDPIGIAPEARSAWPQFSRAAFALAKTRREVIGHGHPRGMGRYAVAYARAGIDVAWRFETVVERADVYVIDNSSTMFEWAALDRPIVVMNARWYRRDVDHGLRFWEFADVGIQVDNPADLDAAVTEALTDPPAVRARRREIADQIYSHRENSAAAAADVVAEVAASTGVAWA